MLRMLLAAVLLMCVSSAGGPSVECGRAADQELFIFGSYFCGECRRMEPFLKAELADLHKAGVKISFIDMPDTPQNRLFARYFLYSASAAKYKLDILLGVRQTLFEIAQWRFISELKLQSELRRRNIAMTVFNPQPDYDHWSELIAGYDIQDTPSAVLRKGASYSVFRGEEEIKAALGRLKEDLQ